MHRTTKRAAVRLLAGTAFALSVVSTSLLHAGETAQADLTAPRFGAWGIDLAGENRAIKPGDDFFLYVNGTAVDQMEIPPDRTRFGSFDALGRLSEERVRAILEEAGRAQAGKIGVFYNSYMDEARVGTTRSRINFFMNKFRKLGFIDHDESSTLKIHRSLLNVIVHD